MGWLRNVWYMAGWGNEITHSLVARTIIDEPVVFYRKSDGGLVALSDTCPHRFAPLHRGKLIGDEVQCGYHGLQFDEKGACVKNPNGDQSVPKNANVKSYPVVEQDTVVWIWMGDPALADSSKIVRYPWLNDTEAYAFTGQHMMTLPVNYELIIDNLLDLSHAAYIHIGTLGADSISRGVTNVRQDGNTVLSERLSPDGAPAFVFTATGATTPDDRVDYWTDMRWDPPATFLMDAGVTPTGSTREKGSILPSLQILTPQNEHSTYYFWQMWRNYRMDDKAATEAIEHAVDRAFMHEDGPMIQAVEQRMNGNEFWSLKPVILSSDSAGIRARRILAKLIRDEEGREHTDTIEASAGS